MASSGIPSACDAGCSDVNNLGLDLQPSVWPGKFRAQDGPSTRLGVVGKHPLGSAGGDDR